MRIVRLTVWPSLAMLLAFLLALPQGVLAGQHVVSPADLQKDVATASQARENNLAQVRGFFSSGQARQALKSAHLDEKQVQEAVGALNDQELARLAAQTQKAQNDFAAGTLSNQDITYILIALATAVVVIILVKA